MAKLRKKLKMFTKSQMGKLIEYPFAGILWGIEKYEL
jgi:hypothetical protein